MNIHAIQTGTVSVKRAHRQIQGPEALRFPMIMLDPNWTEPLPIRVWVIEHPEGVIVVDTGEASRASNPETFLGSDGWFYRKNLRLRVEPHEEIGVQMRQRGIDPDDVRWVVLTHLHSDHADGLSYFPKAEILLSREEFESPFGMYRPLWPSWFAPKLVEYQPIPIPAFPLGRSLTKANDVFLVPTPGHTLGHQSLVVREENHLLFFAGDVTFTERQLKETKLPGISFDISRLRQTMGQIRTLAGEVPMVYLPSHDPESEERLIQRSVTCF